MECFMFAKKISETIQIIKKKKKERGTKYTYTSKMNNIQFKCL